MALIIDDKFGILFLLHDDIKFIHDNYPQTTSLRTEINSDISLEKKYIFINEYLHLDKDFCGERSLMMFSDLISGLNDSEITRLIKILWS